MFTWNTTRDRPYDHERDWWRIRNLIVDTYPITPPGFNWEVRRWDGMRFHGDDPAPNPRWAEWIRVWETSDSQLVGAAHPEGDPGEVHLELHPDYRFLADEMLAWAEGALAVPDAERGGRRLQHFVFDYNAPRQRTLAERGYEQQPWFGMVRRLRFGAWPIPAAEMPAGYTLRTTRPLEADYAAVSALLNAAFRRTIHSAREYRNFTTHSPSFRHDLDLVAEAPDGTLACLVGVTYEPLGRYGVFEPVCTHPDHQRRGLARALMLEGMRRMRALGALTATVDTGDMVPANALYDSMGFTEAYRGHYWLRHLT
jgi:ribosomal protein S18 acetylase RimI-like enzyme